MDLNENLQAVLQNKGVSLIFWDAVEHEELNGPITFQFTFPLNVDQSQKINLENYVLFRNLDQEWQEYIIKRFEQESGETLIKTAFCEHSSIELLDHPIDELLVENDTVENILFQILQGSRWEVGTIDVSGTFTHSFSESNGLKAIHELLGLCGGEIHYRFEVSQNKVTKRYIDILAQRGEYRGKRFVRGKDVNHIKSYENTDDLITSIIPKGAEIEIETEEGQEETEKGKRLTIEEVEWLKSNGDPVDKPLGQKYIEDPEATQRFGRLKNGSKIRRERIIVFDDVRDPAELIQNGWDYLQSVKDPAVTYEIEVTDLEQVKGYEHEAVRLGDTVNVIDKKFNPELRLKARVVAIERNLLEPQNNKVTIGNVINNFKTQETVHKTEEKQTWKPVSASWITGTIDSMRNNIKIGDAARISDTFLIFDKPEDQNPQKAILIGNGQIAIANSKIGNDWNWRTFMTGDYVVADVIQAGTMLADRIRGGDLYLGGIVDGIGKNGRLYMLDENDEVCMQFDAETRSVDRLFVGELSGNNVVAKTVRDITYYIDPENGSDDNNGTISQPFKTFEYALNQLPEIIDHNIYLQVLGQSEFHDEMEIYGVLGSGSLKIDLNNSKMTGYIRIFSSTVHIEIKNGTIINTGEFSDKDGENYGVIVATGSPLVYLRNLKLDGGGNTDAVVMCRQGMLDISNCELYNSKLGCISVFFGGHISARENIGESNYGLYAKDGGYISGDGTAPTGTTNNQFTLRGGQINGSWTYSSGTAPTPPSPQTKYTFKSTRAWSWDTSFNWNPMGENVARQGNPNRWDPTMGNCKGLWFFDYQGIQNILNSGTAKSMRIYVKRETKGGVYTARPVYFWTHNKTSPTGAEPTLSNSAGNLANFSPGEGKWVDLPNSYITAFKTGTAKGIAIYTSNQNSDYYVRMEKDAILEITF